MKTLAAILAFTLAAPAAAWNLNRGPVGYNASRGPIAPLSQPRTSTTTGLYNGKTFSATTTEYSTHSTTTGLYNGRTFSSTTYKGYNHD